MQRRLQALGRLKPGMMNKTEAAFAAWLEMRRIDGEIAWYRFEGIKLRLGPNTSLTVDFPVMLATGELQMIDVKGSRHVFTDDARVKMKIASEMFPFPFFAAWQLPKRDGGGWHIESIGA